MEVKKETVEVTVEYLTALRKAAGFQIDPETAEVWSPYAQLDDPYGDVYIPPEAECIGRVHFASAPGSGLWIESGDLPQATVDAIRKRLRGHTEKVRTGS